MPMRSRIFRLDWVEEKSELYEKRGWAWALDQKSARFGVYLRRVKDGFYAPPTSYHPVIRSCRVREDCFFIGRTRGFES